MLQDKQKEIARGKKIKDEAELLWGWATPAGKLRAQRRAQLIIDKIKSEGFKDILEIGCGTGIFTEYFSKERLNMYGIDICWDLLNKTRQRCLGERHLFLSAADVEGLPFGDNSFDAIIGICVLHHLNVIPALKEIRRVLKKGGMILFSEPNMFNPQLMLQKNIKPIKRIHILGETEDETAFFRWQMKKLLKDAGFRDISINPFDFLHPWTPKFLIPTIRRTGLFIENLPLIKEIAGSLFITAAK